MFSLRVSRIQLRQRRFTHILLLTLLTFIASCSEDTPAAPPDVDVPTTSGFISGVITSNTRLDLSGIVVEAVMLPWPTRADTTAADGKWRIDDLQNGRYVVQAKRSGYAFEPERFTVEVSGRGVTDIPIAATARP